MLIFERLKRDYPKYTDDIVRMEQYMMPRIKNADHVFDDTRENYYWVNEAFKYGPGTHEYNLNMARYELSINFDKDFLSGFFDNDVSDKSVDDLRKELLKENYNEETEEKYKEKIRINK